MGVNKVILLGNVGKDPESRNVSGNLCVTFTLATTERGYTKADGTVIPDRTEWHNIVLWRKQAEIAQKYVRKGTALYIEGKMTYRNWTDKQNIRHDIAEVQADVMEFVGKPAADTQPQAVPPIPPMP